MLARDFSLMSETERINAMRMMFVSVTAPARSEDTIFHRRQECKKERSIIEVSAICTTAYCLRGKRACREKCIAVLQGSESSIACQSADIASKIGISVYQTDNTTAKL